MPDIPENTQIPIPEVISENEEETPNSPNKIPDSPGLNPEATTQIVTPSSIAEEIINEMINIVFEADDVLTTTSST